MAAKAERAVRRPAGPHAEDHYLRGFGFKIYCRPACGPALWILDATLYTHGDALKWVKNRIQQLEREQADGRSKPDSRS